MVTQWIVQEKDRTSFSHPTRMDCYTGEQREFYKNWSAKCYDLNNSILFYNEAAEYGMNAGWSACALQRVWEDFMLWSPSDDQLATLVLHERPSLKCGALAWFALRRTCPDKEYPYHSSDLKFGKLPTYLEEARS